MPVEEAILPHSILERLTPHRGTGTRRVKLGTLIRLRWLAVAGQAVAVLVVGEGLGFPMPVELCLFLVALSAALNLFLKLRYPANLRLAPGWAALLLAYDVLQLGGLLFLTGGLRNPFSILVLVPVMVSAATLAPLHTVLLGALVLALNSVLAIVHLPLPWPDDMPLVQPLLYVGGVWVALSCAVLFMGVYAFRVAEEARQLANALAATELVLTREQHLSALDGLAAAAAHELGTPLATIALVAKELERDFPPDTPHGDDVALLRSQSERCRGILAKLASLATQTEWHHARLPLAQLVAEIVEPHGELDVPITVALAGEGDEPIGRRNPAILYGLGNLVENAVDFADTGVDLTAAWDDAEVTITIADDGPGFRPEVMERLGEPYVTTRAPASEAGASSEAGGLGLGFFIAKTLLERTGARLVLANRAAPAHGAVVTIRWPRDAMTAATDTQETDGFGVSAENSYIGAIGR